MKKHEFDGALFIGTGGGNDVFSASLAMEALWRNGWRWRESAMAGVLSPFHRHTGVASGIAGATVTTPASTRHLLRYDNPREIGFVDAHVSRMVAAEPLFDTTQVLGLSLAHGTAGLTETIRGLATRYDLIVLVDLGGDIFYGGPRDTHVLSPMFDAMVLRAFNDAGVPGLLFEAGPGTDGELTPEALRESLADSGAQAFALEATTIDWWGDLYARWVEPVRTGRTVPITIEAFKCQAKELAMPYRARAHMGAVRRYAYHDQRIDTDLCRHFFLVEPQRIRNPFAVACDGPLDWFLKTQVEQQRTNNEANLEYLPAHGGLWQFLTPSPLFSETDRMALMDLCLQDQLRSVACDGFWILPADWQRLRAAWQSSFHVSEAGPLVELRRA